MFFDPMYFVFALPAMLVSLYAQWRVSSAYGKYSKVRNMRNASGADIARTLVQAAGLYDLRIESTPGELTDHYDPRAKALRLSRGVFETPSVAAMGIVAHEVGHAVQDATNYAPMRVRAALVGPANLGSNLGMILFMVGVFVNFTGLVWLGIALFSAAVLFTLVTLPVELDASNRAMALLRNTGLVTVQEASGARTVLNAAALTYVAAVLSAVASLLYFLFLALGMRRDE
ncbi:MAG: zinc metallopeptidase [Chloroflexota bacterium]